MPDARMMAAIAAAGLISSLVAAFVIARYRRSEPHHQPTAVTEEGVSEGFPGVSQRVEEVAAAVAVLRRRVEETEADQLARHQQLMGRLNGMLGGRPRKSGGGAPTPLADDDVASDEALDGPPALPGSEQAALWGQLLQQHGIPVTPPGGSPAEAPPPNGRRRIRRIT